MNSFFTARGKENCRGSDGIFDVIAQQNRPTDWRPERGGFVVFQSGTDAS